MAQKLENGQTCLEIHGIEERNEEIVRNDYNIEDQYSVTHPDALSDGDSQGKGSGHGGHVDWTPYCSDNASKNMIDYKNFDTAYEDGNRIGDCYDINGRNGIGGRIYSMLKCKYGPEYQYGPALVNTEENQNQGQVVVGYRTKIAGC